LQVTELSQVIKRLDIGMDRPLHQIKLIFAAAVVGLSLSASAQTPSTQPAGADASATDASSGAQSRPSDRGGARGRNFNPLQMRQIQEGLQATDDEWQVIEPRIEKIESLRRAIQGSRFGNRPRRGNPTGVVASPVAPTVSPKGDPTELQTASQQLQEALNNKDTKPQELKARLAALREARTHALAELTQAQDNLREILTSRQEAVLVTYGLLN
jgi:hypothetical protein